MNPPLKSTCIWAICLFLLLGIALRCAQPLKYAFSPDRIFWDQHPLRSKIEAYQRSSKHADFVLIGSSIAMCPNAAADARWKKLDAPSLGGEYSCYSKADYIAAKLSEGFGRPVEGANFCSPGSMMADIRDIIQQVMNGSEKPEIVILCVSPREFVDNTIGERMYPHVALNPVEFAKRSLGRGFTEAVGELFGAVCHLYEVRADYQFLANLCARSLYGKNLAECFADLYQKRSLEVVRHDVNEQVRNYTARYRPFKQDVFEKEWSEYEKLAEFCRDNGTKLYVVNMPIMQQNKDLLPAGFYGKFKRGLLAVAARSGAQFIDLDRAGTFEQSDFLDIAHLKSSGGLKAFSIVTDHINQTSHLAASGTDR